MLLQNETKTLCAFGPWFEGTKEGVMKLIFQSNSHVSSQFLRKAVVVTELSKKHHFRVA